MAYAYILLGRLGRPRQGGNDRYRSTTHSTVVADQYDYKGGHEGGSESSHQAPYAHWVGFVCMGVPQVPPGHPKQGGNDRYRSITHDPVAADQPIYRWIARDVGRPVVYGFEGQRPTDLEL